MSILDRGERAPDFVLPTEDGTPTRFYARAGGRPTVLIFLSNEIETSQFSDVADVFIVTSTAPPQSDATVFIDSENAVRQTYRVDGSFAAFALDANLRVLTTTEQADALNKIQGALQALPTYSTTDVHTQAPVLLIPNILTADICNALINVWTTKGNEETGVERYASGERHDVIDHQNKKRHDHTVTDAKLLQLITKTVGRRVMPEVQRAFHYRATRFEGFKIACYDSEDEGFFHAHRDNLSPATAHRRFALTLNLNDEYEGGHLKFPEYGPHRYRPPTGGAVIFSSSLLHEVQPVRQGRRFTLLSFLFHEDRE